MSTRKQKAGTQATNFSERHGYKAARGTLQLEGMDSALRNSLWNAFAENYLGENDLLGRVEGGRQSRLLQRIWSELFKLPLDDLKDLFSSQRDLVRMRYFQLKWYEVYDFLEFVARLDNGTDGLPFTKICNHVLERELSGYRFVKGHVTPVASAEENSAIEEAASTPYDHVNQHIEQAVKLMSDRKSPDFRNSIKESISAIEALARSITGRPKATLGQALGALEKERGLHPALKSAFSSLYGYTSDENGIRHSLIEESTVDFNDAKFMLVACSAFVNYVVARKNR